MITLQTRSGSLPRAHRRLPLRLPLLPALSLLLAALLACALLVAIYRATYNHRYETKSWIVTAEQMHDVERTGDDFYAFTQAESTLRFPALGQASYEVALQLAGPGARQQRGARINAGYGWLELGTLHGVRSVHVLATVDPSADLQVRLGSPTVQIPPDSRALGLMVARVTVASLGGALPPWSIVVGAGATIALVWLALTLLRCSTRSRFACAMLMGVGIGMSAAFGRGQLLLVPAWLLLGASGLLATALIHGETSALLTSWRGVLLLLVGWRVLLWLVAAAALHFNRTVYGFGYDNMYYRGLWLPERPSIWLHALVDAWMQWDALHYADIATKGYTFPGQKWPIIAFFPLYPLAIRALLPITANNVPAAALLVAHLALLGAVLVLFRLISRDWSPVIGYRCIVLLLCFPTAFFLVCGYSEALALLLTVVAIWAMRRRSYWIAGLVGALLALTRVPGVLIGAAIAAAFVVQQDPPRRLKLPIVAAALPACGLGVFMIYQQYRFGTPVAFLKAQQSWNNGSGPPWSIPLALWTSITTTPEAEMAIFILLVWAAILALIGVALKQLPIAYSLTALLMLPALLARQPSSLTRYVVPVVPLFLALALVTEGPTALPGQPGRVWLRWAIMSVMIAGLVGMTALFVNGFFIA